jgi:hypothetical protein
MGKVIFINLGKVSGGGSISGTEDFFFEKKNQKTWG